MYTLLSIAKAHHASDLHITVGVRPKCRISGTLYEMDGFDKLTPAMTKELVESMFGPKQKATMEATGEVDFAYTDTRVPCQCISPEGVVCCSSSYCGK